MTSATVRTPRPRCAYCAHPLAPVEIAFEDGDTVCADVARCGKKRRPTVVTTVIPVAPTVVDAPSPVSPVVASAAVPLTLTDAATLAEADAIALLRSIRAFKHGGHRGVTGPDDAFDRARVSWHAYRRAALAGGRYDRAVDRWRGGR